MIDNKVIEFGYGTILVGANKMMRRLILKYIQPPKSIGQLTDEDVEDIVILEEITFDYQDDMKDFLEALGEISRDNPIEEFRGYTFDFSNYNEKSVEIVKEGVRNAINGWQLVLAC